MKDFMGAEYFPRGNVVSYIKDMFKSWRGEKEIREAPLFLDLNEPAVRQIYEYLKKRREERERKN